MRERLPWSCRGHSHVCGRRDLVLALSGALSRTKAVLVLWDFADPKLDVSATVSKAVGLPYFNISKDPDAPFNMPRGAVPFVGAASSVYGYFLESGKQSIIVLSSLEGAAEFAAGAFLVPYFSSRYGEPVPETDTEIFSPGENTAETPGGESPGPAENIEPSLGSEIPPDGDLNSEASGNNISGGDIPTEDIPADLFPPVSTDLQDSAAGAESALPPREYTAYEMNPLARSEVQSPEPQFPEVQSPVPQPSEATFPEPQSSEATFPAAQPSEATFPEPQSSEVQSPAAPSAESALWEFDFAALEASAEKTDITPGGKPEKPAKKAPLLLKLTTIVVSILIILVAGFAVYDFFLSGAAADRIYSDMESKSDDFTALTKINPDFAGWLKIDSTKIDFPVVIPKKKSPDYYKNHVFTGLYNKYGTPRLPRNFSIVDYCRNTVITAENRGDGHMFSDIEKYLDKSFLEKNPVIYFESQYYTTNWKVVGVVISREQPPSTEYDPERSAFADDGEFTEYLSLLSTHNLITTDAKLDANDILLTLIAEYSQADGYNIALIARKLRYNEDVSDPVTAAVNGAVVLPESGGGSLLDVLPEKLKSEISSNRGVVPVFALAVAEENSEQSVSVISEDPVSSARSEAVSSASVSSAPASSRQSSSKAPVKSSAAVSKTPSSSVSSALVSAPEVVEAPPEAGALTLTVTNQSTKAVETGAALDIVARVVEAEMGSSFHPEALKAQAITAYTWILNQGGAPQVPMKTAGANAINATREVLGKRVYYGGKPAQVYYFAMSAGRTAASTDTWTKGTAIPYLISVDSSEDKSLSKFQTINTYSAEETAKWIKSAYGIDLSNTDKSKWFTITPDANRIYIRNVSLGGLLNISGNDLRLNVFKAANTGSSNALRSHAFTVTYSVSADTFTFTVLGYGHGVGMSQEGANLKAKKGSNYTQIIQHYFPGVTVS